MTEMPVISADSHIQEPPELYSEWLDAKFRDRAPRTVSRDGKTFVLVDGKKPRRIDLADERANEEDQDREFRSDPTGGRDVDLRLKDMARDGVMAEVIYPNSSLALYLSPNAGYQYAVALAYNDWLIQNFSAHKNQFAPVGIVPVIDIGDAVAEVQRVAKLGYRAIKVPLTVANRPYNLPEYEPLWSAIEETGLVLSLHAFAEAQDYYPEDWGEDEGVGGALIFMAMSMARGQYPVAELIASGALQRHPDMKFVVVECGAGWLAWLLHVLDEQVDKKHMWIRPQLEMKPSEFFRRQGAITFSDDPIALRCLDMIGAETLLWGSDYPHDEGTFPNSQEVIARTFADVAAADKRKIVHDDARRIYGFDL
ncbi:MAG: amidohydrolase [Rhodospirillaceae bacterium]|nr:amidohydrolase [Rhodospirillaceae bacterium]MBT5456678.1 amidohydrolase [Rhodospirillaceae bacterium]MBT7759591.1 amidohydrolase [Rhodospirillaceae bacterium]